MATSNKLQVRLAQPCANLDGHGCLAVQQGTHREALEISFQRTIRVPDDGKTYDLPPGLGAFPLYNSSHYQETLPPNMAVKGGVFMPVHDNEALWINFNCKRPFAVKVAIGGVNAISGEPVVKTTATSLRRALSWVGKKNTQDYVVLDPSEGQLWLDGIAKTDGKVMQFIAVPAGDGYSVEAQITGAEAVGGVQISVTPLKLGKMMKVDVHRLDGKDFTVSVEANGPVNDLYEAISAHLNIPAAHFKILFNHLNLDKDDSLSDCEVKHNSQVHMVLNIQGGGAILDPTIEDTEMGIAAGGLIRQSIIKDNHKLEEWDGLNTATINVQLLNALDFTWVTCIDPPASPITAADYAAAGLPFFALPASPPSGIHGKFGGVKSIAEIEGRKEKGAKGRVNELQFPVVQLDPNSALKFRRARGRHLVVRTSAMGKEVGEVDDGEVKRKGWKKWICQ